VTIGTNGTVEVSPYAAVDADYGTSRPGYSRGCLNAIRSSSVLNSIGAYYANAYLRQSSGTGPRGGVLAGSSGSKEATVAFYKGLLLDTNVQDSNLAAMQISSAFL